MGEDYQLFIELSFLGRLLGWDKDSQVELDVLQSLLREFGPDCLFDMVSTCAVSSLVSYPTGEPHWIEFWFKLRGAWTFFVLEVRAPNVLVLWDRSRR